MTDEDEAARRDALTEAILSLTAQHQATMLRTHQPDPTAAWALADVDTAVSVARRRIAGLSVRVLTAYLDELRDEVAAAVLGETDATQVH